MSTSAYDTLRREAQRRIEDRKLDPERDVEAVSAVVDAAVAEWGSGSSPEQRTALRDPRGMTRRIIRSIRAHGPLTELLARSDVEEVFIEGETVTYLADDGRLRTIEEPTSEAENRQLVSRLLADSDRRLDIAHPIVQARVLGGTARLTAAVPPIADRLSATIRRYALRRETLPALVDAGSLSKPSAEFLRAAVRCGASIIVSGPPGAGKTTMVAALLAASAPGDCVRCVEEVRELQVGLSPHSSFYEARPPSGDDPGVSLRDLVKLVLAMRPDRIVVGEVRGSEAYELTRAGNAGCGFVCTVHANSARDALHALVNAALMAGENVTESVVRNVFASTIDIVVHLGRSAPDQSGGGMRRAALEILAVAPSLTDGFTTEPIFVRDGLDGAMTWTDRLPPDELVQRLESVVEQGTLSDVCSGAVTLP